MFIDVKKQMQEGSVIRPDAYWSSPSVILTSANTGNSLIVSTVEDNNKVVLPSLKPFEYGSCAEIAIGSAFDLPGLAFRAIYIAAKMRVTISKFDEDSGLTFYQCKKIINILAKADKRAVIYHPNKYKATYAQMVDISSKNYKYLVMFDNHLSYCTKGKIYDSYFDEKDVQEKIPTGWWMIKP